MHQGLKAPLVLIACQSVDFFGDAAVCLRLAQGLVARGAQVRIIADPRALAHLQKMAPACAWEPPQGFVATSALAYWAIDNLCTPGHGLPLQRADLLLEAFQMQVPQAIFEQLPEATLRYLVDYLALEEWTAAASGCLRPTPSIRRSPGIGWRHRCAEMAQALFRASARLLAARFLRPIGKPFVAA
jgi:hypothetical protein